ncbi:MAG: peptidase [Acidobacteria bacterium]|nr:peptidase [Acidobacteriota bacterium]
MLERTRTVVAVAALAALTYGAAAQVAQERPAAVSLTTPKTQFGFDIGDDYRLANYTQYVEYLKKLDAESARMTVLDIGPTEDGRTQYTAVITSPENQRRLDQIKATNRRLALAEDLTDEQARALARDAKVVVWIDGGLHASEVLGAQQLIELIYELNSRTDPETVRILDNAVVLCTLVNPDGMELVSNWYMRDADERRRSTSGLPRLYQKYIGHDNNRDFYMMNMSESGNANRIMYREWFPAIMYNHHQTGPRGAVLFAPPFRDPFNYNYDPLVPLGINLVGAAIHTRLAAENKPGAVMRSAAPYSTWFNGSVRTTSYFHNQIGILTETIGNPTPVQIPLVPGMQLPRNDVPYPVAPQTWHFRRSIEYSMTMNYAVLDLAAKRKEDFLFNMYRMAKNAIANGSADHWTMHPQRLKALERAAGSADPEAPVPAELYDRVLHDPAARDPRGFIISADQPDFPTAVKFVNTLIKAGVVAERATSPFTAGGKSYPAGSFVFKAAQPFRAHLMDMFEPQDHPDDIPYPGAPPTPPYDVTGYNLSYSMGIGFDRILDDFDGPFETVPDVVAVPAGRVTAAPGGGGYLLSHRVNDAFVAVNRLLKAREEVQWARGAFTANGKAYPAGTMFIPAKASTLAILQKLAVDKGLTFEPVPARPAAAAGQPPLEYVALRPVRIGLWDTYGGSMASGWTRWILEQYEFPFERVFPQALDAGSLNAKFDVLLFVDGGIPMSDRPDGAQPAPEAIPAEYRDQLGRVTVAKTVPALKQFVENGGTLLTIGSSATAAAFHFDLPVGDALVEQVDGAARALREEKFYVPGAILEARIDNAHPLAYGMGDRAMVIFDHSPAFRLEPSASAGGAASVAWFESASPLRSGWAWGQQYLKDAVEVVAAPKGKGQVVLFGPEVAWRGQPHGTFKLLFNGLFYGVTATGGPTPRRR